MKRFSIFLMVFCAVLALRAQPLEQVAPASVGLDAAKLAYADQAINRAISRHDIPGAVLAVVRHGKMAYLKAYGHKSVYPKKETMTVETVFDMASCSKSMSTAVAAMILIERGQLRLMDRVDAYIPGFENWKDDKGNQTSIRIVDLMTHTSGLPPYADVNMLKAKYGAPNRDGMIDYIAHCRRDFEPTTDFQYSCLNYITLQRIIETISGQNLRDFAKENIFDVLGMSHTDYNPSPALARQCAPTEKQPDGKVLQGIVHDPLARIMNGGISGNAGVFSTAADVAILCAALQNGGEWNGHRILSPLAVKCMRTVPRRVANIGRTPGWDVFTDYATNKGDLLSDAAYGHTGFTGTSIVIDPENDISVILLTNAVHPDGKGSCIALRSYVANSVAAAILQ
ncbi:CubicO group peptidase, beta-lactamase class C family [Prevotella sp. kh1p2]|nr:CubicO group peptidase, beta-lactamase class C family [Prevotella sp. kh1p2]SNU12128.1 CubicO group peptidase, beta-lactamase class C family [Prevotellaceae bacterium KH2P17]